MALRNRKPLREPVKLSEAVSPIKLANAMGIRAKTWHGIIVGDGSGSKQTAASGFAGLLLRPTGHVDVYYGRLSPASIGQAELMASLHPLLVLDNSRESFTSDGFQVNIVTDSQYVHQILKKIQKDPLTIFTSKRNGPLLNTFAAVGRKGFVIKPHVIKRNSTPFHTVADTVSKMARTQGIVSLADLEKVFELNGISPKRIRLHS